MEDGRERPKDRPVLSDERRLRILIAAAAAAAVGGPVRILDIHAVSAHGRAKWNRETRSSRALPRQRPAVPHLASPGEEVELG
jgi:hypothetical protein